MALRLPDKLPYMSAMPCLFNYSTHDCDLAFAGRLTWRLDINSGKRLMIMAAVTDATLGCDLLVSVHDIRIFEECGMRLSTR